MNKEINKELLKKIKFYFEDFIEDPDCNVVEINLDNARDNPDEFFKLLHQMKKRMDYGVLAIKPDAHKPFKKGQKIRILQRHYDLYFKGVKPKKEQIKTISRVSRQYKSDWDIYTTDGYGYSFDCVEIVQKSKK